MKLAIVLFFMLTNLAHAFEEPDNFRGVKWNATPEEARHVIEQRGLQPSPKEGGLFRDQEFDHRLGWFVFRDKLGQAEVAVKMWFLDFRFVNAELTFDSGFFSTMEAAFKERYGKPTIEKDEEIQTRAGATFMNRAISWIGKEARIRLQKYGIKITHGWANVGRKEYVDHLLERQKKRATDAAKNL